MKWESMIQENIKKLRSWYNKRGVKQTNLWQDSSRQREKAQMNNINSEKMETQLQIQQQ